jgi:hypothetical protein
VSGRPAPSEIVAALYALTGRSRFSSDANIRHCAFFQASESSPLLRAFGFAEPPPHPYSPVFDAALAMLKLSRVIRVSGDLEEHLLDAGARAFIEREILPRLTGEERAELSLAATIFAIACARD